MLYLKKISKDRKRIYTQAELFRVRFRVSINGARPKKHRQTHQTRTQAHYVTPSTKAKTQQKQNIHTIWGTYTYGWSWVGIYG